MHVPINNLHARSDWLIKYTMQLTPYSNNGLELVIDNQTGAAYASASAIARMVSTPSKTISVTQVTSYGVTLIKGVKIDTPIEAEINTVGGFQGVKLYNEKAIREFAKKYNPDLFDKFADAGIRVFLHQLAGYQVTSTAVQPKELTKLEILELALESEKKLLAAQEQIELLKEKVDELAQYGSIIRAAKHNNVDEAIFNWRILKKASISNGWVVKRVPCPRFKWKNLYDVRAFQSCYPDMDFEFDCDEVS